MTDELRGNHQLVPMLLLKLAYQPTGLTRARLRAEDWNGAHDQAEAEDDRAEEEAAMAPSTEESLGKA